MAKFIVRRSKAGDPVSGILPATPAPMGTALQYSSKDADSGANTFKLADGNGFLGFQARESRATFGLTDEEQLMGYGMETPYQAGTIGSVELATEIEAEGTDFLVTSGTGAIATNTAAGTKLGFTDGKFRVAQTNDRAFFELVAVMTPEETDGVRIYARELAGDKVTA